MLYFIHIIYFTYVCFTVYNINILPRGQIKVISIEYVGYFAKRKNLELETYKVVQGAELNLYS